MRTVIASAPSPDNVPFLWVHTFWTDDDAKIVAEWLTGLGYKVLIV